MMLHASWRAALRQSSRSQATLTTTRAASRFLPAQCTASSIARYPHRGPSPPAALYTYRSFSSSVSRQKEKDPKDPKDPKTKPEEAAEETEETKKLKEQEKAADELEAKTKTPDPVPSKTGSGRGSAAGPSKGCRSTLAGCRCCWSTDRSAGSRFWACHSANLLHLGLLLLESLVFGLIATIFAVVTHFG